MPISVAAVLNDELVRGAAMIFARAHSSSWVIFIWARRMG